MLCALPPDIRPLWPSGGAGWCWSAPTSASLPVVSGEECIRVVWVEDGSLLEVTHALADAIGTATLKKGIIFLIGSLTHLSTVGTQQYITDWVRSRWWLKNRFGENCMVLPLVPVSVQGITGKSTVRSLLESLHWFMSLKDTETVLVNGIMEGFCTKFLACTGIGTGTSTSTGEMDWANSRQYFRVPAALDTKATVSLVSEGWGSRPDCIPPLSQAAERVKALCLINVLNGAFDLGLCASPVMDRSSEAICSASRKIGFQKLVAAVGGSHAARLAEKLMANEVQVVELTQPGWRISKRAVELVATELTSLIPHPNVIILQCMDNSTFFCQNEDGSLTLPVKALSDGKYHMVGDLRIAARVQVNNLFNILKPLLSVMMTMKRTIRSLLHAEKFGGVRLLEQIGICQCEEPSRYVDGVHLA